MVEIGFDEFLFWFEMFIKNNGEINVRVLMVVDLGDFM